MSAQARDHIEFANAITLTNNSFATGQSIKALKLIAKRVVIISIRRDEIEMEQPGEEIVLQSQDTLVLRGKPRRVERAERYLQEGN
jgi:CPA2 family monovalent cation:H+ antiporter-2